MIRPISIEAVSNGWIATVGCQRVVYNNVQVMAADLVAYLTNPENFEKQFMGAAVNALHTNGPQVSPVTTVPTQYSERGYEARVNRTPVSLGDGSISW